ncbi:MAG: CDIF630_02480 family spore surface protein [Oscillospiraceae bacterium]
MPIKREPGKPVEKHRTAAWSSIERISPVSRTAHPDILGTENAKEYVEENQK